MQPFITFICFVFLLIGSLHAAPIGIERVNSATHAHGSNRDHFLSLLFDESSIVHSEYLNALKDVFRGDTDYFQIRFNQLRRLIAQYPSARKFLLREIPEADQIPALDLPGATKLSFRYIRPINLLFVDPLLTIDPRSVTAIARNSTSDSLLERISGVAAAAEVNGEIIGFIQAAPAVSSCGRAFMSLRFVLNESYRKLTDRIIPESWETWFFSFFRLLHTELPIAVHLDPLWTPTSLLDHPMIWSGERLTLHSLSELAGIERPPLPGSKSDHNGSRDFGLASWITMKDFGWKTHTASDRIGFLITSNAFAPTSSSTPERRYREVRSALAQSKDEIGDPETHEFRIPPEVWAEVAALESDEITSQNQQGYIEAIRLIAEADPDQEHIIKTLVRLAIEPEVNEYRSGANRVAWKNISMEAKTALRKINSNMLVATIIDQHLQNEVAISPDELLAFVQLARRLELKSARTLENFAQIFVYCDERISRWLNATVVHPRKQLQHMADAYELRILEETIQYLNEARIHLPQTVQRNLFEACNRSPSLAAILGQWAKPLKSELEELTTKSPSGCQDALKSISTKKSDGQG